MYEAAKIALSAIWASRLRSSLTLLGVVIGVTSMITIISALEGLMNGFADQVNKLGPATFVVTKMGFPTSEEAYLKALKRKNLTMEDRRALENGCRDCEKVAARAYNFTNVKRGNKGLNNVPVLGATANLIDIVDFEIGEGRSFSKMEYDHNNRVVVIGPTIVEELFDGQDPLGKVMKIKGRRFTVVGIAKERGSFLGNNQDLFAMMPLTAYAKLYGRTGRTLDLMIKSTTIAGIEDTQDQVRAILRARRGVSYKNDDDFSMLTAENLLAFVDNLTRMMRFVLIGISSIALVVGGVVIMNIMLVSVSERTREIGIRKAIGARRKNILWQFLFESLLLSLGGGIIGTGLGVFLAMLLGSQLSLSVSPSVFAISAGLITSTTVGVVFGLYPAAKASKLDPIVALQQE